MPSYPASASQLLGQTIDNGALRIEAILGAGSFGVVYRAVDTRSGTCYAVKRVEKVHSDYYQSRETQLHARVSCHPHVLTFHREIDGGHYAFFVYDLCAGDLQSVIKKLGFFREDELIKRVFVQIIDALEFCHSRGVYHRDLKPENILVSSQKSGDVDVYIADFGLATTNKFTASSCGTPCFMSPEMIATIRPWSTASPDDRRYNNYLVDGNILFNVLLLSDAAYSLLTKIFSPRPEHRPSLAAIRAEVLAMDTFFMTDEEATKCGLADRVEQKLLRKMERGGIASPPSGRSDGTSSSGSCYSSCTSGFSSSASCYSCGSSSSAFESMSSESSELPITPPAPAVEVFHTLTKAPSRLELGPRVAVARTA